MKWKTIEEKPSSQIDLKKNCKKVVSWHYLKLAVKMAMGGAEGIGTSFYGSGS